MGNGKSKRKQMVVYSSLLRNYSEGIMIDTTNSFEVPDKGQTLFLKLPGSEDERALMKVVFLGQPGSALSQKREAEIESEYSLVLKLNESPYIVHCMGREYCNLGQRRCEILCQLPQSLSSTKAFLERCHLKVFEWMAQAALGIKYLHEAGSYHGGLTPESIGIVEGRAVLQNFPGFRYFHRSSFDFVSLYQEKNKKFIPPELFNPEFAIPSDCKAYWTQKQDIYLWALIFLYNLQLGEVIDELFPEVCRTPENILKRLPKKIMKQCKEIEEENINVGNMAHLIAACLHPNPLMRPSILYALRIVDTIESDMSNGFTSFCNFCGFYRKRLHELKCTHTICKRCLAAFQEEEEKGEEICKEKKCKLCYEYIELNILQLKCGCSAEKLEIAEFLCESTKRKIISYNSASRKYVYPSCFSGHSLPMSDLELIFGEEKMQELRIASRKEGTTILS